MQRFVREAAITARLQHPGIVPLYDLGRDGEGRPFLCMKLVEGASLEQKIGERSGLTARLELLPHVIAAAEAMAYAHRQGVIHRDLKPANILVGEFGEAVVIDWGLAKDMSQGTDLPRDADDDPGTISDLTAAGSLLGTIRYMPPEQARGEPVDARSDIYALGAVLYHLIAGVPPFHDRRSAQLVHDVLAGSPRRLAELVPEVPPALVAIVGKAMSRETGRRYADAGALADDLRRFQAGRLVGAHSYSLGEVGRLWLRRHRAVATIAAASVVALGMVSVVAFGRVADARDAAEEQRAAAESARAVAEQRADEAEVARATADRRAEELLVAQARLALEVDPARVYPLLAQLDAEPGRDNAVRTLATAAWSQAPIGAAVDKPDDSLVGGVNLSDGTWIVRGLGGLWRWSPGTRAGENLGASGALAVDPSRRTWAVIRGSREAEVELHEPGAASPRRYKARLERPPSFYEWQIRPGGAILAADSDLEAGALEIDLTDGTQVAVPGPDAPAAVVGLHLRGSPDGRRYAGVRERKTLVIWDRQTNAIETLALPGLAIGRSGWSRDGEAFHVGCSSTGAEGLTSGDRVLVWRPGGPSRVREAAWSVGAREALVFVAHGAGGSTAWAEAADGRRLWTRDVHTDRRDDFVSVPWTTPDGRLVAWGFGIVQDVVDVASGTLILRRSDPHLDDWVLGDGEILSPGPAGLTRIDPRATPWWSLAPAPAEPMRDGGLADDGAWAVVPAGGQVSRIETSTGAREMLPAACGPWTPSHTVAGVADDGRVLVRGEQGAGCLWGHGRTDILELPRLPLMDVAFAAGGRFAVASADGSVLEWSEPSSAPRPLAAIREAYALRYTPDGSALAVLDERGGLTVVERGAAARTIVEPLAGERSHEQAALAFAPAGATLAVHRRGQANVEVVDLAADTRTRLSGATTSDERGPSMPLRFSPSGQAVALLDGDLLLRWSLARPDEPTRVPGVRGHAFAFLDEQTIAVVDRDSAVALVDTVSGVHGPMREGTGGRVWPRIATDERGLILQVGSGELLRFTDALPSAGAPLQAWLRDLAGAKDMP